MNKGHAGNDLRIKRWVEDGYSDEDIADLLAVPIARVKSAVARLKLRRSPREAGRREILDAYFDGVPTINHALFESLGKGDEPDDEAAARGDLNIAAACAVLRERHLALLRSRTSRPSACAE